MEIDFNKGLSNSQSYRTIEDSLSEINFEKRFTNICKQKDLECGKIDLKLLIEDVVIHYRNRLSQDFDENFW
jgi:hypothetical protein